MIKNPAGITNAAQRALCSTANYTMSGHSIVESEALTLKLENCTIGAGVAYGVQFYVEDENSNNDGQQYYLKAITPVSNSFTINPYPTTDISANGLDLRIGVTLLGTNGGKIWMFIVNEQTHLAGLANTVTGAKALTGAQGSSNCQRQAELISDTLIQLVGCSLRKGETHYVYAYVEDSNDNSDGTLAPPLAIYVPASNVFTVPCYLKSTPVEDGVKFTFTASEATGKLYAAAISKIDYELRLANTSMLNTTSSLAETVVDLASYGDSNWYNFAGCWVNFVTISGSGTTSTTGQVTTCNFQPFTDYKLLVYIEADHASPAVAVTDGSLAILDVNIGPKTRSNWFTANPLVDTQFAGYSYDKVYFSIGTFAEAGYIYAIVISEDAITSVTTVNEVKSGKFSHGGRECKLNRAQHFSYTQNQPNVQPDYFTHILRECELVMERSYYLVVYIEDLTENNDGTIASVRFTVPVTTLPYEADPLVLKGTDRQFQNVVPGARHYYHVRGVNAAGVGMASGKSDSFYNAAPPSTPLPPVATHVTRTSVNLKWEPPYSGGLPVVYYVLYMAEQTVIEHVNPGPGAPNSDTYHNFHFESPYFYYHADGARFTQVYHGTDPEYSRSNLRQNAQYRFQVRAANAVGVSNVSDIVNITLCSKPTPPRNVRIVYRTNTLIKVWWDEPLSTDGCPIVTYRVKIDDVLQPESMARTFWIDPAVLNQGYFFQANVRTEGGPSLWTDPLLIIAGEAPGQLPKKPVIVSSDKDHVSLRWEAISSISLSGLPLLFYRIYARENNTNTYLYNDTSNPTDLQFTLFANYSQGIAGSGVNGTDIPGTLKTGTEYCIAVAAMNNISAMNPLNDQLPNFSPEQCVWTAVVPDPPIAMVFNRLTLQRIIVTWPDPADNGGAPIDYYEISMKGPTDSAFSVVALNDYEDKSYWLQNCVVGAIYSFIIRSHSPVGYGASSNQFDVQCATLTAKPDAPKRVSSSTESIGIKWAAPNNNGGTINSYRLFKALSKNGVNTTAFELMQDRNELSAIITPVIPGQEYQFKVSVYNSVGYSEESEVLTITAAGIPTKVRNVTFDNMGYESSTNFKWLAPASDGGSPIFRYEVYYGLVGIREPVNRLLWTGTTTETGLLPFSSGVCYQFQIFSVNAVSQAFNVRPEASDTLQWCSAIKPSQITFTLIKSDVGELTFRWNPPVSSGGGYIFAYNIYLYAQEGGKVSDLDALRVATLAYEAKVTGLATNFPYFAEIRAQTTAGESPANPLAVVVCDPPATIASFKVVSRNATNTLFQWTMPTQFTYCPILGYSLFTGLSTTSFTKIGQIEGKETTNFTYGHAVPGVGRYYKVVADNFQTRNFFQTGTTSSEILFAYTAGAPAPPMNLQLTSKDLTTASLAWTAPLDTGGSPITGYYIQRNDGTENGTVYVSALSANETLPTTLTHTVTSLLTGFTYKLRVAAASAVTTTNQREDAYPRFSDPISVVIGRAPSQMDAPVEIPDTRTATGLGVRWTKPTDVGGQVLTKYRLFRDDGISGNPTILVAETDVFTLEFTVTGLTPGARFSFGVTAENAAGVSVMSPLLTTFAGQGPEMLVAPSRDTSIRTSGVQINLKWVAADIRKSNKPVLYYKLLRDDGNFGDFVEVGTTTFLNETIGSLRNSLYYRFVVQAYNEVGWGPFSPVFRSQVCGQPQHPDSFYFAEYYDNGVLLRFTKPTDGGCDTPTLTKYEIYQNHLTSGNNVYEKIYEGEPTDLFANATNLNANEQYQFQIRVSNFDQSSDVWPDNLVLLVGAVPRKPNNLFFLSAPTATSLQIGWVAPVSKIPILQYRIYFDNAVDGAIDTVVETVDGSVLNITKAGLTAGAKYRFQIQARNQNGWGERSGVTEFYASLSPRAPNSVSYYNSTIGQVYVQWEQPVLYSTNDAPFSSYNIFWGNLDTDGTTVLLAEQSYSTNAATRYTTPPISQMSSLLNSNFTSGTLLHFRVQACTINTCGPFTDTLTLVAAGLPKQPDAPSVVSFAGKTVSEIGVPLSWAPYSTLSESGAEAYLFAIYSSTNVLNQDDESSYTLHGYTESNSANYNFTCVQDEHYFVKVAAINGAGGNYSAETSSALYKQNLGPFSHPLLIVCTDRPETPAAPSMLTTQTSISVVLFEPNVTQLKNATHVGWELEIEDLDDGLTKKCVFTYSDVVHEKFTLPTTNTTTTTITLFQHSLENLYAPNLSPIYVLDSSFVVSNQNPTVLQGLSATQTGGQTSEESTTAASYTFQTDVAASAGSYESYSAYGYLRRLATYAEFPGTNPETVFDVWKRENEKEKRRMQSKFLRKRKLLSKLEVRELMAPYEDDVLAESEISGPTEVVFTWSTAAAGSRRQLVAAGDSTASNDVVDLYDEDSVQQLSYTRRFLQSVYIHTSEFVVVSGHRYTAKIRLCSNMGCSDQSAASEPTYAADSPSATDSLAILSTTNEQIAIQWDFNNGTTNGAPLTGFCIYISQIPLYDPELDANGTALFPDPNAPCLTCGNSEKIVLNDPLFRNYTFNCAPNIASPTFNGSQNVFFFQVAASNQNGIGPRGEVLPVRCSSAPDQPAAPFYMQSVSNSSQVIGFTLPNLYNARHVSSQMYRRQTTGSGATATYSLTSSTTDLLARTFTSSGLVSGEQYEYYVTIASGTGTSVPSATTTIAAGELPGNGTITFVNATNSSITVQITVPTDYATGTGGAKLSGYRVFESADGVFYDYTSPNSTVTLTGTETSQQLANLFYVREDCVTGSLYWFSIQIVNQVGEGLVNEGVKFRCSAPPATPAAPTLVTAAKDSLAVRVERIDPDFLNLAKFSKYIFSIDDGAGGAFESFEVPDDETARTFTFTNLTTGLLYKTTVQVFSDAPGASEVSAASTFYAATQPSAPLSVSQTSSTSTSMVVSWNAPADNGGLPIQAYNVYTAFQVYNYADNTTSYYPYQGVSPAIYGTTPTATVAATTFTLADCGISSYGGYVWFKVAAYSVNGEGEFSEGRRFFCAPKPEAPSPVTWESSTATSITVNYKMDAETYNVTATGFALYYNDGLGGTSYTRVAIEFDTNPNQFTITGLTAGRRYKVKLAVVSFVGEGTQSAETEIYAGQAPSALTAPTRVSSSFQHVEFQWSSPGSTVNGLTTTAVRVFASSDPGHFNASSVVDLPHGTTSYQLNCEDVPGPLWDYNATDFFQFSNEPNASDYFPYGSDYNASLATAINQSDVEQPLTSTYLYTVESSEGQTKTFVSKNLTGTLVFIKLQVVTLNVFYGEFSDPVSFYCAPPPLKPIAYEEVASTTSAQVALGWSVQNTYGARILQHKVYNGATNALITTITATTGLAPEFVLSTGIVAAQTYQFQVATVTEVAEGDKSDVLSIIACSSPTVNTTLPAIVSGNKVFNSTTDTYTAGVDAYNITFNWPAVYDTGGCPVTDYKLYLEQETATSETVPYNDTDFFNITNTTFNDTTNETETTITELSTTNQLTTVFAGETEVYIDVTDEGTLSVSDRQFQFASTRIEASKTYTFRIGTITTKTTPNVTIGPTSDVKAAGLPNQIAIAPVRDAAQSSSTSVFLTWTAPDNQGGYLFGFTMYRDGAVDTSCGMDNDPTPPLECLISGLSTGASHSFSVQTRNEMGSSPISPAASLVVGTNPVAHNVTTSDSHYNPPKFTVTWNGIENGATIYNFIMVFKDVLTGTEETKDLGGTALVPFNPTTTGGDQWTKSFEAADFSTITFAAQREYQIKVKAINAFGQSAFTAYSASVWTLTEPSTPANFQNVTDSSNTTNKLQFTAASNTQERGGDGSNNVQYIFEGDTTDGTSGTVLHTMQCAGGNCQFQHENLQTYAFWYYRMRSKNQGYYSAYTAILTVQVT
ncbi:unnamed protein product [Amoebophrya sp. A120]|nr:unnamed protein product [Amoebophrya sp. A120]|eukprot:GSA120T00010354001.1